MLGTTDAFFLQRLTGRAATDVTTAARTGLMNLASGAWDPELCRLFGVPLKTLPPITPPLADFGSVEGVPLRVAIVDQLAAEYNGKLTVAKVDIDENPMTPSKFMVRGIPTLLLFKNGDLKETVVGLESKDRLAQLIDKHL